MRRNLKSQSEKIKLGVLIPVKKGDVVKAFVFVGVGSYKDADLEKPAFLRHKLIDRFRFKRSSDEPVEVLEVTV